jgi:hypothetical protein
MTRNATISLQKRKDLIANEEQCQPNKKDNSNEENEKYVPETPPPYKIYKKHSLPAMKHPICFETVILPEDTHKKFLGHCSMPEHAMKSFKQPYLKQINRGCSFLLSSAINFCPDF